MRRLSTCSLKLSTSVELEPDPQLQAELDTKFSKPQPLAPTVPDHKDEITPENYEKQNREFASAVYVFILEEMNQYVEDLKAANREDELRYGKFMHLGIGEGHDLDYIAKVMQEWSLEVIFIEASKVVCTRMIKVIDRRFRFVKVAGVNPPEVVFADIEKLATVEGAYDQRGTMLVYGSRVFQLMPPEKLRSTLKGLGKILGFPERRMIVVHPFPEDNANVVWGKTIPHNLEDILAPLREVSSGKAMVTRQRKIAYFSQTYTAFTVKAA